MRRLKWVLIVVMMASTISWTGFASAISPVHNLGANELPGLRRVLLPSLTPAANALVIQNLECGRHRAIAPAFCIKDHERDISFGLMQWPSTVSPLYHPRKAFDE